MALIPPEPAPSPHPAPELRVEPFQGSESDWDQLIDTPDSTFCHRYGWRRVMQDGLGHDSFWLVARDPDGVAQGALPLVHVRSRLFGNYLISMPFLNYGGPVGTPAAQLSLLQAAQGLAADHGVDLLETRNRHVIEGSDLVENIRKLTVVKDLPAGRDELWEQGIKAKVRSQVRRPMKEGMEIHFGPELLDGYYEVFARTMRDLGTPVLPRRFFESILAAFGDDAIVAVVVLGDEPVAAGFGLAWRGEFEITWAGASREHAKKAPNMLLYWGLMEECVRRGYDTFNFGRCTPGSGTHRFKKQWGSEDQPLPWLQWSPSGVASTPNPDSGKFQLATRVWSRLPVGLTNVIGPRVSRLIP